jgi:starch phosphorylase
VARRATPYKRNDLLLSQPDRLRALVDRVGPLQVVYSGKAHPLDAPGKALIERVNAAARALAGTVTVVYLENYGMDLAALLVAGVDVWLNNPVAPHEASGTSGMKAALNGVPSLSVLDGWWVEGHIEGITGWAIGSDLGAGADLPIGDPEVDRADGAELYRVLQQVVAPLHYGHPDEFAAVRRSAIALNGSFFTTQRMVAEYAARAYRRALHPDG